MKHKKHKEILSFLYKVEQATLDEIYENVSFSYYANWKKHLGAMLSTLVKQKKVVRLKPGLFKLAIEDNHKLKQENLF